MSLRSTRSRLVCTSAIAWLISGLIALSQTHPQGELKGGERLIEAERGAFEASRRQFAVQSSASDWFDVTYYRLDLHLSVAPPLLSGSVQIRGVCNFEAPPFLVLDLASSMHIDSAEVDGRPAVVLQQPFSFSLTLDSTYHLGNLITANIHYHGLPTPTGYGSFTFASHNGYPWIWSFSEPYGARDWWPCKDQPGDKADYVDVFVTCDSTLTVGGNGTLKAEVINADGSRTTHWHEHHPIAPYLVAITASNFSKFSDWFRYTPSDSMEILNYVLPESLASAQIGLVRTVDGLRIFSSLFGLYPFIDEKYGHAQWGAGAMEHQTMTSTGTFDEETIIHELAHQWFGDMITCRSWQHIWLNEGFATYCVGLYYEMEYGFNSYRNYLAYHLERAKGAVGTVLVQDTTQVREIFDGQREYSKGAAVLHMLRHLVGDTVFFQALRAYANDPSLKYGTAETGDLESVFERVSGKSLDYFFGEWIRGENYPHYRYWWSSFDSSGRVVAKVTITQTTGTSTPTFFTMPIDIRLVGAGWDTIVTVFNNQLLQTFSVTVRAKVDSVQLDPGGWLLKSAILVPLLPGSGNFQLYQNYPNPFNISTTIHFDLPHRAQVTLEVFNLLGERVATLVNGMMFMGSYEARWDAGGMPSGVYFCRLEARSELDRHTSIRLYRKLVLAK